MEACSNTVITQESLTGALTHLHLLLACSYFIFRGPCPPGQAPTPGKGIQKLNAVAAFWELPDQGRQSQEGS